MPLPMQDTIAQIKREVLEDIRERKVPVDVRSFSELHDYVDANEYGGFCDPESPNHDLDAGKDEDADYVNDVQDAIHGWLARGGHILDLLNEHRKATKEEPQTEPKTT